MKKHIILAAICTLTIATIAGILVFLLRDRATDTVIKFYLNRSVITLRVFLANRRWQV